MDSYILEYTAYDKNGDIIKSGKMRAKNKLSEFEAKCGLEKHLKTKYVDMYNLVIHSCYIDFGFDIFNDFSNKFGF